jgi:hypothetical protein
MQLEGEKRFDLSVIYQIRNCVYVEIHTHTQTFYTNAVRWTVFSEAGNSFMKTTALYAVQLAIDVSFIPQPHPIVRRKCKENLIPLYEGRLKSSWTGGSAPAAVMQREAVTVIPDFSGTGNVVVA